MRIKIAVFILSVAIGYLLAEDSYESASLASTYSADPLFEWDALPNPNKEEFEQIKRDLRFKGIKWKNRDDDKTSKIMKVLKYLKDMRVNLDQEEWGLMARILRYPYQYVVNNTKSYSFIDTDFGLLARNRKNGHIGFAPLFFHNRDPYELMTSIIHEARHSEPKDPSHRTCSMGYKRYAKGSCDSVFEFGEDQGAYATGISLHLFFLEHYQLTLEQRREIESDIVYRMLGSFNGHDYSIVQNFERVILLGDKGRLFELHPFIPTSFSVDVPLLGQMDRLDADLRHSYSLYDYSTLGNVEVVDLLRGISEPLYDAEVDTRNVMDLTSWYSRKDKKTFLYALSRSCDMYRIDYSSDGSRKLVPLRYQDTSVRAAELIWANKKGRYFLSDQGKLHLFNSKNKTKTSQFKPPRGEAWAFVNGGLNFGSLYGISDTGELFYAEPWGNNIRVVRTITPNSRPIKKYMESPENKAFLMEDGHLVLQNKFAPGSFRTNRPWNDAVILYGFRLLNNFVPNIEGLEGFCQLGEYVVEPWTQSIIGINGQGELVAVIPSLSNPCQSIDLGREGIATGVEIEVSDDASAYLKVNLKDGDSLSIYPFSYTNN